MVRIKPNRDKQTLIVFSNEGDEFNINALSDYLQNLKGAYAYFLRNEQLLLDFETGQETEQSDALVRLENTLEGRIIEKGLSQRTLINAYKKNLKEDDLYISTITKQSPLTIVFSIASLALTAAAILSGGKVKGNLLKGDFEIEVNSLGDGLLKIQDVLARSNQRRRINKALDTILTKETFIGVEPENSLQDEINMLKRALNVKGIEKETKEYLEQEITKRLEEIKRK